MQLKLRETPEIPLVCSLAARVSLTQSPHCGNILDC